MTVPRWDRFESKRNTQELEIFLINLKIKLKHKHFKISYIETGKKIKKLLCISYRYVVIRDL